MGAEPQPSGYAESDGVQVAYYETGSGLPLLLINGGPGFPAQHFGPLAHQLASRLQMRVIRFDQRGTGRSTLDVVSNETLSLALMVHDIEALRRSLGIDGWVVMGHSFGAVLAMAYAAEHRTAVRTLILSAPAGVDLSYAPTLQANIHSRLTAEENTALELAQSGSSPTYERQLEVLSILLSAYVRDKAHLPSLRRAVIDSRVYVPAVGALVMSNLARDNHDLRPGLARLGVPTLILQGDEDPLGLETALEVHHAISSSELVIIPNASHYGWLDNPQAYFAAVRRGV